MVNHSVRWIGVARRNRIAIDCDSGFIEHVQAGFVNAFFIFCTPPPLPIASLFAFGRFYSISCGSYLRKLSNFQRLRIAWSYLCHWYLFICSSCGLFIIRLYCLFCNHCYAVFNLWPSDSWNDAILRNFFVESPERGYAIRWLHYFCSVWTIVCFVEPLGGIPTFQLDSFRKKL